MRYRLVPARIVPLLGLPLTLLGLPLTLGGLPLTLGGLLLLALGAPAWAQEPPTPSLAGNEQTVTVAGRVLGHPPLQDSEVLAVLLLPGWSERLSADIAAGVAPTLLLHSGRVEQVAGASSDTDNPEDQRAGSFEFRNIPPGEYQAVAIRLKEGADAGAAIAETDRVVVGNLDIANLELDLTPLPLDQSGKRHGGAEDREPALLQAISRPRIELGTVPVPRSRPVGISRFPSSGGVSKKDLLGHILVGLGIAATVFTFTRW